MEQDIWDALSRHLFVNSRVKKGLYEDLLETISDPIDDTDDNPDSETNPGASKCIIRNCPKTSPSSDGETDDTYESIFLSFKSFRR